MNLYTLNINDVDFDGHGIIWTKTGTREQTDLYISKERYERSMKFRYEADRKRSLCAAYLLNHAVRENHKEIVTPVTMAYEELNGKPYLPDYPGLYFNLSHSGDYAVCVLDSVPVGVDVEECKVFKEKVAKRFFAPEEYDDVMSITDEAERRERFYIYWVLKESFMKATGLGMQLDMKSFRACISERITYVHTVNDKNYEAKIYDIAPGYCMAVCRMTESIYH